MPAPKWHMLFPGSPSFKAALAAALAREAAQHGIDLAHGFGFMPAGDEVRVRFTDKGVGYFKGDLVGPDNLGEPVRVAWTDAKSEGQPLDPGTDVSAEPERVHGWWDRFLDESALARYRSRDAPPFPVAVPDGWKVTWEPFSWPEPTITLELTRALDDRAAVDRVVSAWRDEWHRRDEGTVHGWRVALTGPRTAALTIDFGSAPTAALGSLFQALDRAARDLPIAKVSVGAVPPD